MRIIIRCILVILVTVSTASAQEERHIEAWSLKNSQFHAFYKEGKYQQALEAAQSALSYAEEHFGSTHRFTAVAHINVASAYRTLGAFSEAEPHYQKALDITTALFSRLHEETATAHNGLTLIHTDLRRLDRAEHHAREELAILEELDRPQAEHIHAINNLAVIHLLDRRFDEARHWAERAVALSEDSFGKDDPNTADALDNLAQIFAEEGKPGQAIPLTERALQIDRAALGGTHPIVALRLSNLGLLYTDVGDLEKAADHLNQAAEMQLATLPPGHPQYSVTLTNLAGVYARAGNHLQAGKNYQQALAYREAHFGADHPETAISYHNMSAHHLTVGELRQAKRLAQKAFSIRQSWYGDDHLITANARELLAFIEWQSQNPSKALQWIAPVARLRTARLKERMGERLTSQTVSELIRWQDGLDLHALLVMEACGSPCRDEEHNETLLQLIADTHLASPAGMASLQLSNRILSDTFSDTYRGLQDLRRRIELAERSLLGVAGRDLEASRALRQEIASLRARFNETLNTLQNSAQPTGFADVPELELKALQAKLKKDDIVIAYSIGGLITETSDHEANIALAITQDSATSFAVTETIAGLQAKTNTIRSYTTGTGRGLAAIQSGDAQAGNDEASKQLFHKLLAPIEKWETDTQQIYILPDGPLQALPFGALKSETGWFGAQHAVTTLPSLSAFRSFGRHDANINNDQSFFVGVGHPLFEGNEQPSSSLLAFSQRGVTNTDAIKRLAPLPEAEKELKEIARHFSDARLLLKSAANEREIKDLNRTGILAKADVVAFATHGFLGGELQGFTQPGLALTPPKESSIEDDGYLSAAEILDLQLNADLVILSACNTAAGETQNAEGLSGLARSFIYAGARGLIVTHAAVLSDAAVQMTTKTSQYAAENPELGYAEAMRLAIKSQIDAGKSPAHWAPFLYVSND